MIAIKMEILLEEKVPKKMSSPPTRRNNHKLMQMSILDKNDKSATFTSTNDTNGTVGGACR